jgi:hypothetical protein
MDYGDDDLFAFYPLPGGGRGQVFARAGSATATVAASANRVIQRVKREEVGTIYKLFALHPIFPTHPFAIIIFNPL